MASFALISGPAGMEVHRPHLFRERTRLWYARLSRTLATDPLTVKVYAVEADAAAGNANFSASGTVAYALLQAALVQTCTLVDNAAVPPTFTGASIGIELDALTTTGNSVWKVDLGKRIKRSVLRVIRAFSKILKANGYFHDLAKLEGGMRTWEDAVGVMPYLGITGTVVRQDHREIGRGPSTELTIDCVGYVLNDSMDDVTDTMVYELYEDVRRALALVLAETDQAAIDNGGVYNDAVLSQAESDKGIVWERERGALSFAVIVTIEETTAEVEGG